MNKRVKGDVFEGQTYRVFSVSAQGDLRGNEFILEEKTTGNYIKKFKNSGMAIAMAKGLDAGLQGWNGWTPAFIARSI